MNDGGIPSFGRTGQHCIYRFVNDACSIVLGQIYVDVCSKMETFAEFWPCIETAPHSGGHGGIGGKMWDGISSPGDPVFYLHHTWLDKLSWEWQARDLPARLHDISGRNVPAEFVGLPSHDSAGLPLFYPNADQFLPAETLRPPPDVPRPEGDPGNATTLAHVLNMFGVVPNAIIRDVMDIAGPLLCYEYV
ncbi:hypothetical protein B0T25DRAFT_616283 [Lasiosphaeria hispida]|uniref:Tyrosinase copper-binding domain-containing protein n=1 Tax=Lasiosphaeria hispida TaxID=260671 RepID=A0AAJ0MA55_9PEZI|nr:hypothetical protein B0T25DRAFT_616283 [Lasiosphaeria hispida]